MPYWVVSYYSDGDKIIEAVFTTREAAEAAAEDLREFRDDQDEMPRIEIEEHSKLPEVR